MGARRGVWLLSVVALSSLAGCDELAKLTSPRSRFAASFEQGCDSSNKGKKQADCKCLAREFTQSLSDDELRLMIRQPKLLSEEELGTYTLRNTVKCFKPAFISACNDDGTQLEHCTCVADAFLDKASGPEVTEISERLKNGSALPSYFLQIRADCGLKYPPKPRPQYVPPGVRR